MAAIAAPATKPEKKSRERRVIGIGRRITVGEIYSIRNKYPTLRGSVMDRKLKLAKKYGCSVETVRRCLVGDHLKIADKNLPDLIRPPKTDTTA